MDPDIRLFPDSVLRKKAKLVKKFDEDLRGCVQLLDRVMRAQPHGIGIAAPQIGISRQIALVDVSSRVRGALRLVLVNPEILEFQAEKMSREGCMSLPEYTGQVKRYDWVRVRWHDEYGVLHEKEAEGIEAVCIQHEVDHLNGKLFVDRVSMMKRDMIPRRRK